jgi:hypothetical protein
MSFNLTESAKWAQANQKVIGDLHTGVDKALADAAARGFPAPPGGTLTTILSAIQEAKAKLTEANGKIYEERRADLFQQEEFAMKIIVQAAKLGMELYREELLNALAIEQAEAMAERDRGRADVERMNSEIDARQVAIIQARAEMEHRITVLKAQLVEAEAGTLVYETALINAQVATAEKKLEIINSIYLVLAAEELVLAAEHRRAETLTTLLAAENVVAEVKRAMVPLYIEKAGARRELADAITKDIPVQKAIVELGYDRVDLENRKEFAAHLLRLAENELELAKAGWTRANNVLTLTQLQSRRFLQAHENDVQKKVLELKESLVNDGLDFRLFMKLANLELSEGNETKIMTADVANTSKELDAIVDGLAYRAESQARAIMSGKKTSSYTHSTQNLTREISG